MTFVLKQFEIGPMQNLCYLIGDQQSRTAVVVDPAWDAPAILNRVENEGFKLSGILVSHAHYDHTNGIASLLQLADVPVYAHPDEVAYSRSGNRIVCDLSGALKSTETEQTLALGETTIRFLHTPGHTPGSQCFLVGNNLITGDTLFIGGCGRSDLPGGHAPTLYRTLRKLASLSGDLVINPGHDYGPSLTRPLSEELKTNPYLSIADEQTFVGAVGG